MYLLYKACWLALREDDIVKMKSRETLVSLSNTTKFEPSDDTSRTQRGCVYAIHVKSTETKVRFASIT